MPLDQPGFAGGDAEPPDLSGQYNTDLTPDDEARYQAWGKEQAAQRQDKRNPAADTYDYDMRGFWRSGEPLATNGHGADAYKKPNHPTFSNQSRYHGADGQQGGTWGGGQDGAPWTFTPSDTNLRMHGAGALRRYFDDREKGNQLILPQSTAGFGSYRGGALRRDYGGSVPAAQVTAMGNPMEQAQAQRYAGMSEEQLQELALRAKGSPQGAAVQRALSRKRLSPPAMSPTIAPTAAPGPAANPLDPAAGPPEAFALGGQLEAKGGVRMPERGISGGATPPSAGGFLHTAGPGRTDNLNIKPHADSYVLPADVVSGLGSGNSLAGAKALDMALKSAPYGAAMPTATHAGHRMGPPHPPAAGFGRAAGGKATTVPIIAAGGEYIVSPEQVRAIGHGDIKRGHECLDAFVLHVRRRTIGEMRKLKGPVKS